MNIVDEAKLHSQFIQLLKRWLCDYAVRHCCGELGPFCWPMLAAGIAVLVHLIDLLSILLRCNGFSGIQKAVEGQTGSRPPNHDLCFGTSLALRCGLELLLVHWAGHQQLSYKIYFSSRGMVYCCCIEYEKTTLEKDFFLNLWSAHEAPTYWAFSPFQLASNPKQPQNGRHWVLGQLLM